MDNCSSVSSDHCIGVSTGNWGCGAFGGNPEIKSMIQWIAASQVHKKCYYTVEFQGYQYW
jgi:poly(ADP-ribose) glycohydrolase